ncbi:alpha/beta fold hydrolase [Lacimicrobium alkaliphilum]|uniref:Alpha/beta hydrolase n=1 Tax=Lacimicrobium alkaliphilum TaxID=1526571 RepID=A0ABQ1R8E4_9ALTE|nr:alpha/beta hydrolase [Lacimicrobium alkaliphilum]GGD58406.1 alpha/beta hydrolase [Lacimicrobium alkaliphilum]
MSKIAFLPGTLCNNAHFSHTINALQADGHQCIDVHFGHANCLTDMAAAVLNATQKQPCYLAAFSMGGMVAFELLRQHPETVKGVILISSNAHKDKPGGEMVRREHLAVAAEDGLEHMLRQYYLPKYQARPTPQSQELIVEMAQQVGLEGYKAQLRVLAERPDSYQTIAVASVPFLLISGEKDPLCPPAGQQRMAARAKQVKQILLAEAGHFVSLDQPEAVTESLSQWLREQQVCKD